MINIIIETLATATDVLFCAWFIPRFNGISLRGKYKALIWMPILLCYQLMADHLFNGKGFDLLYMAGILFFTICFAFTLNKDRRLWSLLSAFVHIIVLMLSGTLVYSTFAMFFDNIASVVDGSRMYLRIMYICVCKIVQLAFYRLMLQIFRRDKELDITNGILSFSFTILTALGLGALMKIATDGNLVGMDILILIIAVIFILLNVVLYLMLYQMQSLFKSKYALSLMQERMSFEKSKMEEAYTIWSNIRKVKHDLKNHFTVIKGKLEEGDIISCKQYLNDLDNTVESMGNLIRSGNHVIDYLINSKLSALDDVHILISGYVGNYNDIDDIDLVCVLGNILDNAIEAQKNVSSDKRIELHFMQNKSSRVIVCKNSIECSVLKNNKQLRTTKESPELHGMGHQIVENAVKKYNGWIDYFEEDNMFGVQIMLPVEDKSIK